MALAAAGYGLWIHPPVQSIASGEVGIRSNRLTGGTSVVGEGPAVLLPGLHVLRRLPLRDQLYRPADSAKANGPAPFQSVEGLSLGVDLSVRYALDPARVAAMAEKLPADIGRDVVQPAVQGVVYKVFTRYTVREIFSSKRAEIQQLIETETQDPPGHRRQSCLRGVLMGSGRPAGRLPRRHGQAAGRRAGDREDALHAGAQGKNRCSKTSLEGEAAKVKREKDAEAAGREQIIAARAQEEAMKTRPCPSSRSRSSNASSKPRPRRSRTSSPPKATRRPAASSRRVRPIRARNLPTPRSIGSTRSGASTASRWPAKVH